MEEIFSSDCLKFDDTSLGEKFNDTILITKGIEQVYLQALNLLDDTDSGTDETKYTRSMEELETIREVQKYRYYI